MNTVEWITTNPNMINNIKRPTVIGGIQDGSPLWVIRADIHNDMVPGKLIVDLNKAYISWGGRQYDVLEFEVACADANKLTWLPGSNGFVPSSAVIAGYVRDTGEHLYVGKSEYLGQVICGKIERSRKVLSITYNDEVINIVNYDVLCVAPSE